MIIQSFRNKRSLRAIAIVLFLASELKAITTAVQVKPLTPHRNLILFNEIHHQTPLGKEQIFSFIKGLKEREKLLDRPLHILLEQQMGKVNEESHYLDLLGGLASHFERENFKKTTLENIEVRDIEGIVDNEILQCNSCANSFSEQHCPESTKMPDGTVLILRDFTFENLFEGHKQLLSNFKIIYGQLPDAPVKASFHTRFRTALDIFEELKQSAEDSVISLKKSLEGGAINITDSIYLHAQKWSKVERKRLRERIVDCFTDLFDLNAIQRIITLQNDEEYDDIALIAGAHHCGRIKWLLRDSEDADSLFSAGSTSLVENLPKFEIDSFSCSGDELSEKLHAYYDQYDQKVASFILTEKILTQALLADFPIQNSQNLLLRATQVSLISLLLLTFYSLMPASS